MDDQRTLKEAKHDAISGGNSVPHVGYADALECSAACHAIACGLRSSHLESKFVTL